MSSGGRYDPLTDTWVATAAANAPTARDSHTAVWTGSEMIVWGGSAQSDLNTGGRYSPDSNTWAPDDVVERSVRTLRPHGRMDGDGDDRVGWISHSTPNTGGRYNPGTDTWAATSIGTTGPIGGEHARQFGRGRR